jgi:phenylacetic acid degradation protein
MPSYAIENLVPVVDPLAYVHPTAVLIGDVIINKYCYIGPNAVLRGDFGRIVVGQGANVQDTCVIHSFPDKDCVIEENGHIGHGAILHGCHIGKNALVGMNAVIMDDAVIGAESLVAATAFVKSAFECPPRSLLAGSPATIKRQLTDKEVAWKTSGTKQYHHLTERCQQSLHQVEPLTKIQSDRPRFTNSAYKPKHED